MADCYHSECAKKRLRRLRTAGTGFSRLQAHRRQVHLLLSTDGAFCGFGYCSRTAKASKAPLHVTGRLSEVCLKVPAWPEQLPYPFLPFLHFPPRQRGHTGAQQHDKAERGSERLERWATAHPCGVLEGVQTY